MYFRKYYWGIQAEAFHRHEHAKFLCEIISMDHNAFLVIMCVIQVFIGLNDRLGYEFRH